MESEAIEKSAMILCHGMPAGSICGLDGIRFPVPAGFDGFRVVPAGTHLLVWSSSDHSPCGHAFIVLKECEVVAFRWSKPHEELLLEERRDPTEATTNRARMAHLNDPSLLMYPLKMKAAWQEVTSCLNEVMIRLLSHPSRRPVAQLPDGRRGKTNSSKGMASDDGEEEEAKAHETVLSSAINSMDYSTAVHSMAVESEASSSSSSSTSSSSSETKVAEEQSSVLLSSSSSPSAVETMMGKPSEKREGKTLGSSTGHQPNNACGMLHWTSVPGVGHNVVPTERTEYAMDTSTALGVVLMSLSLRMVTLMQENRGKGGEGASPPPPASSSLPSLGSAPYALLAELQASFLLFALGQEETAFDQWKALIDVLCRCEDILVPLLRKNTAVSCEESSPLFGLKTLPDGGLVTSSTTSSSSSSSSSSRAMLKRFDDLLTSVSRADQENMFISAYAILLAQISMLPKDFFAPWDGSASVSSHPSQGSSASASLPALAALAAPIHTPLSPSLGRKVKGPFLHQSLLRLAEFVNGELENSSAPLPSGSVVEDSGSGRAFTASFGSSALSPLKDGAVSLIQGTAKRFDWPSLTERLTRSSSRVSSAQPSSPFSNSSASSAASASVAKSPQEGFASMEALLESLREAGGDDDLPAIVYDE